MLHKTRGIVFKTTNYSESSVIVQVFTEKFGIQSYLVNGVKKPKAKISQNILQPLHLLEMVVYHKPNGSIQRIAEARQVPAFQTIPYDVIKSSVAIFINEVLYRAIRIESSDEVLFNYIFSSIELLDRTEVGLANFHLFFLLRLTQFLGFYPERSNAVSFDYFDLKNGAFTFTDPGHTQILRQPHTAYWAALLSTNFTDLGAFKINQDSRKIMLAKLLEYYKLHIDSFGDIRSLSVLEEVLS